MGFTEQFLVSFLSLHARVYKIRAFLSPHSTIQLTYADFALVTMISGGVATSAGFGASVDEFPKIRAHQQAVESLPNIKQWIEKRPESEY